MVGKVFSWESVSQSNSSWEEAVQVEFTSYSWNTKEMRMGMGHTRGCGIMGVCCEV